MRRFWNAYATLPVAVHLGVIGAALLLTAAVKAASPYLTGEALQADIAAKCTAGCVTFSQEEAAAYERGMEAMIQRREADAFMRGQADARERCASLI